MIDNAPLRELIEFASPLVEKIFRAKGEVTPMWHAIQADGTHFFLPAPRTAKDTAATLVRALFELKNVVRCLFISEAWTIESRTPSEAAELEAIFRCGGGLSEHPMRVEMVMMQAEDADAGTLMGSRVIIRPAKGRAYLGPLKIDAMGRSEGRLVGMLPRRGATVQ
jgi:hypothetical protein